MLKALDAAKSRLRKTPLCYPYIFVKGIFVKPRPQNDEATILQRLLHRYSIPKTFIEFGFSGWEFNCAPLAHEWRGLLVDGDLYNIRIARTVWGRNITAIHQWLTLENLSIFRAWLGADALGILSVDVDGNDFWFLQALIGMEPALIIAEYNSSFGRRCITVPYDPAFDRSRKHESMTYYGASLTALNLITRQHGYSLIEVGNTGINAFFVKNDLLTGDDIVLNPEGAFREKLFLDGTRQSKQWQKICNLPYVELTKSN